MKTLTLLLLLLCAVSVQAQNYGIAEVYYDQQSKMATYGFSHYQSILDTTITWSSYSWYWSRQFNSKQWFQYWLSSKFALGLEVEIWQEDIKESKLLIIPRMGVQYRVW